MKPTAACATQYVAPTSGPTASVQLNADYVLVNKDGDKGACNKYESIVRERDGNSFILPAGKEVWVGHSFIADGPLSIGNCRIAYVFTPEAGIRYVARASHPTRSTCTATLHRLTPSGEAEREPTVRRSRWPAICQLPG